MIKLSIREMGVKFAAAILTVAFLAANGNAI